MVPHTVCRRAATARQRQQLRWATGPDTTRYSIIGHCVDECGYLRIAALLACYDTVASSHLDTTLTMHATVHCICYTFVLYHYTWWLCVDG